jgi:hypothetical protein
MLTDSLSPLVAVLVVLTGAGCRLTIDDAHNVLVRVRIGVRYVPNQDSKRRQQL